MGALRIPIQVNGRDPEMPSTCFPNRIGTLPVMYMQSIRLLAAVITLSKSNAPLFHTSSLPFPISTPTYRGLFVVILFDLRFSTTMQAPAIPPPETRNWRVCLHDCHKMDTFASRTHERQRGVHIYIMQVVLMYILSLLLNPEQAVEWKSYPLQKACMHR